MAEPWGIIVSCEHAGNQVPRPYAALFSKHRKLLRTHRGFDPGARELSERLAETLSCPLFTGRETRLLVDLNRSVGNPVLFSSITAPLAYAERARLLEDFYVPYRRAVESAVRNALKTHAGVLHLSVHTFNPVLDGVIRSADVGLLYDPKRPSEKAFCARWKRRLVAVRPSLTVRSNYPYRGDEDGLTTYLRRRLRTRRYLGIELELNQKHVPQGAAKRGARARWKRLRHHLIESLHEAMKSWRGGIGHAAYAVHRT